VDGEVRRPAIYETKGETTIADVVNLAGGLTPEADASSLSRLSPPHPAVRALLAGQRSVTLAARDAAVVYDAAESVSRALGEPFPLQFTPVPAPADWPCSLKASH